MLGQNPALRACSGLQREGPGASASYGYGKDFGNAKPRNRLSVDIIAGERNSSQYITDSFCTKNIISDTYSRYTLGL